MPLIATPNVNKVIEDKQERQRARLHATCVILMQNKYYSFCQQVGQSPRMNYAMGRKGGG